MEWMRRLNAAVEHIESHLTEEIRIEQLAKIACCSTYHFQRMFAYMADVPLSEYIRRRRMSLAAVELQQESTKIIDVALKFGYASPTAFNRAFHSVHGIAPSQVKENSVSLRTFPPISFKITVKGAEAMDYKIVKKDAFRVVGISRPMEKEFEKNFAIIPPMWETAIADGTIAKLAALMKMEPMGMLGISVCGGEENGRYFIAVANEKDVDGSLEEYVIPAATWAVFEGRGPGISIQQLCQRIVTEWLPSSGFEYADGPDIEVYYNKDTQDTKYEVWIPVRKA